MRAETSGWPHCHVWSTGREELQVARGLLPQPNCQAHLENLLCAGRPPARGATFPVQSDGWVSKSSTEGGCETIYTNGIKAVFQSWQGGVSGVSPLTDSGETILIMGGWGLPYSIVRGTKTQLQLTAKSSHKRRIDSTLLVNIPRRSEAMRDGLSRPPQ